MLAVGIGEGEGLTDVVCDTTGDSVEFEDFLAVLNEDVEVEFVFMSVTGDV